MASRLIVTRLSGFNRSKILEFDNGPLTLGTDLTCEITFDPTWDKTVSPRHAVLSQNEQAWSITDQSRDGLWLDGRKISRHNLASGDVLELGRGGPTLKFEFARAEGSLPPVPAARLAAPVSSAQPIASSAAARPVSTSAPTYRPVPAPAQRPYPTPTSQTSPWLWLALAALVLLGGGFLWLLLGRQFASTEDAQLAQAARQLEPCVGLVVLIVSTPDGERSYPFATAWAVGEHTFATNGHVAEPVKALLAKGGKAFIVISQNPGLRYTITGAQPHPQYGIKILNPEGKEPAVPAYDVGILNVSEYVPVRAPLASADELAQLDSGQRIAYLGFPMENLAGDGVDFRNPVATMQSGIVTSVTDYWMAKADSDRRLLIQHNLGAAGGASGSPVFNTKGEVVGILSAGNIIGQIDVNTGQPTRAPSGVMINFAQRVDLLNVLFQYHGNSP